MTERRTIAVVSRKGGAGKTTLAMNLAAVMAEKYRTMLLDADPQQSAVRWAHQRPDDDGLPFAVRGVDISSAAQFRGGLEALAVETELVILDTPPEIEDAATVALLIADLTLVPVTPSPLDIWAAEAAVELAQEARAERHAGDRPLVSLVPYRLIAGTNLARDLPGILKAQGEPVAPGIVQRVAVAEAAILGQTIAEYAPGSPADEELRALARHTLNRLRRL